MVPIAELLKEKSLPSDLDDGNISPISAFNQSLAVWYAMVLLSNWNWAICDLRFEI